MAATEQRRYRFANRRLAAVATVGLGMVLLLLGGVGILSAIRGERAVAALEEARLRASAFGHLRSALDDERLVEHALAHGREAQAHLGRGEMVRRFRVAASEVSESLAEIRRHGTARDRQFARRVGVLQARYRDAMRGRLSSSPGGDGEDMHGSDAGHGDAGRRLLALQAPLRRIQDRLRTTERRHSVASLAELRSLRDTARGMLTLTAVASPLSLLLFAFFGLVLRGYRRQEAEATRAELELLEQIALTDNLTGLRNHRAFHEDLERDLGRAERSGAPLSLVMLDLDALKEVNDRFGHQEGDDHLRALAACMVEASRAGDACYRVGGDEFALILPGETAVTAISAVQRLLSNLSGGSRVNRPSASVGIAETDGSLPKDELIRRADIALYDAKRSERPVVLYRGGLESPTSDGPAEQTERHLQLLVTTLAGTLDAKDPSTRGHSETVGRLCRLIADELGLEPERVARLELAGRLHDVGKITIPDAILQKPTGLTAGEHDLIKTHAPVGGGMLQAAGLEEEAIWVRHHHERIDGTGYPDGLAGERIPLESRLLLVADAFEAITAGRPYRSGRTAAEALAELRRHAGTQFDAACVAALERVVGRTPAAASTM